VKLLKKPEYEGENFQSFAFDFLKESLENVYGVLTRSEKVIKMLKESIDEIKERKNERLQGLERNWSMRLEEVERKYSPKIDELKAKVNDIWKSATKYHLSLNRTQESVEVTSLMPVNKQVYSSLFFKLLELGNRIDSQKVGEIYASRIVNVTPQIEFYLLPDNRLKLLIPLSIPDNKEFRNYLCTVFEAFVKYIHMYTCKEKEGVYKRKEKKASDLLRLFRK